MAHWIRALAALLEDRSSVPSSHIGRLITNPYLQFWGILFQPPQVPTFMWHTLMPTHTDVNKSNKKKKQIFLKKEEKFSGITEIIIEIFIQL